MVIDNRDIDRVEERHNEEKKVENRRDVEKRMQYQPMKTFEAKLAEKAAHEITAKESAFREAHDQKKTKKEQQSLLDKIIGTVKSRETEKDKGKELIISQKVAEEYDLEHLNEKRVPGLKFQEQKSAEKHVTEKVQEEKVLEGKKSLKELSADKKPVDRADPQESQETERSPEGHKRVVEKEQDQGEGHSGGSGQGFGGGSDGQGGSGFGQQSGQQQGKEQLYRSKEALKSKGWISRTLRSGNESRGFDRNARDFSDQELDEIVSSVQVGMNAQGEEEFAVTLGDDYFTGLKVVATNTSEGVVLKFICPTKQVLSTFLKFRPKVYARFLSKNISVVRIDVI